jgi:hypothetical protein
MDNNNYCAQDNKVVMNGNGNSHDIHFTLYHNESETSLGQDLDSFYETPHNHIENTKRETEKRYLRCNRNQQYENNKHC